MNALDSRTRGRRCDPVANPGPQLRGVTNGDAALKNLLREQTTDLS